MKIQVEPALCRDCQACMLGCSLYHDAVCSPARGRVVVTKDMVRYEFDIRICHHCGDPDCLAACPAGAMSLDERGVVKITYDLCTRCGSCAEACPFDAVVYHGGDDRFLKCDLCEDRREGPLCVELCPANALTLIGELA